VETITSRITSSPNVEVIALTVHFKVILQKRKSTDPHKPGMPGISQGPKSLGGTISNCGKQITPDCFWVLYICYPVLAVVALQEQF
jgi:hypothetical protein